MWQCHARSNNKERQHFSRQSVKKSRNPEVAAMLCGELHMLVHSVPQEVQKSWFARHRLLSSLVDVHKATGMSVTSASDCNFHIDIYIWMINQ